MEQARPGITEVLEYIEKNCKSEIMQEEFDSEFDMSNPIQKWETVGRELMSVLIDKTEGEARSKIKSVKDARDGINAYRVMHEWFSRVSGLGLSERRRRVMLPSPPGKEDQVVPAIGKWERDMRELEEMDDGEGLSDKMKIVAIQNLVVGHMKDVIKRKEWDDYDTIRSYIMSWAMRLRAEHNTESMTKGHDMDISLVNSTETRNDDVSEEWWVTDQEGNMYQIEKGAMWQEDEHGNMFQIGKGKSNWNKGYGKGGKGTWQSSWQSKGTWDAKGKGKGFKGSCYNCGETGHPARLCPKQQTQPYGKAYGKAPGNFNQFQSGSFSGNCHTCGTKGHKASQCQKGKGYGKSQSSSDSGKGWKGSQGGWHNEIAGQAPEWQWGRDWHIELRRLDHEFVKFMAHGSDKHKVESFNKWHRS